MSFKDTAPDTEKEELFWEYGLAPSPCGPRLPVRSPAIQAVTAETTKGEKSLQRRAVSSGPCQSLGIHSGYGITQDQTT